MENKQQTALQDLIDELKQFKKFPMVDQSTIDAAIEFAELRLEMEKQQIETAYQAGDGDAYNLEQTKTWAEQYYNETYGGNK